MPAAMVQVFMASGKTLPSDIPNSFPYCKNDILMFAVSLTLLLSGILSGMIQYFVDFKKLPVNASEETRTAEGLVSPPIPTWISVLWKFVKDHWQFFAYILIGIAGAFLTPLIDTFANHLMGLDKITTYTTCK